LAGVEQTVRANAQENQRSSVDCLNTADNEHMAAMAENKQQQGRLFSEIYQAFTQKSESVRTCQEPCEAEKSDLEQLPSNSGML